MGITKNCSKFLFYAKSKSVKFDNVLTLGRQHLYVTKKEIQNQVDIYKAPINNVGTIEFNDQYCEPLFRILGAKVTDSMDVSDYEGATIMHDLNKPIGSELKEKYDLVLDAGTIEHVFDFKLAITNAMEMVKTNGHFIGISPVNNLMGHGFYQFCPELFYAVFNKNNGFEMISMIIAATDKSDQVNEWYEVVDPTRLNDRVVLMNSFPTYILFIAKRIEIKPIFQVIPQQSSYVHTWAVNSTSTKVVESTPEGRGVKLYRKIIPHSIRGLVYRLRKGLFTPKISTGTLGQLNSEHYRRIDF